MSNNNLPTLDELNKSLSNDSLPSIDDLNNDLKKKDKEPIIELDGDASESLATPSVSVENNTQQDVPVFNADDLSSLISSQFEGKTSTEIDTEGRVAAFNQFRKQQVETSFDYIHNSIKENYQDRSENLANQIIELQDKGTLSSNLKEINSFLNNLENRYTNFLESVQVGETEVDQAESIPFNYDEIANAEIIVRDRINNRDAANKINTLTNLALKEKGIVPPQLLEFTATQRGFESYEDYVETEVDNEAQRLTEETIQQINTGGSQLAKELNDRLNKQIASGEITVEQATDIFNTEIESFTSNLENQYAEKMTNFQKKFTYSDKERELIKNEYKIQAANFRKQQVMLDAKKYSRLNYDEKLNAAFKMGWANTFNAIGFGVKALGMKDADADLSRMIGRELSNRTQDELNNIQQKFGSPDLGDFGFSSLLNPDWYAYRGASTVPFVLSLLPLQYAGASIGAYAAGSAGLGTIGTFLTAGITGAAASRPMESFMEAGMTYNEVLQNGGTQQEALDRFDKVYSRNMSLAGLDALQIGMAFAGLKGMKIPRKLGGGYTSVGLAGITEGVEEQLQGYFKQEKLDGFSGYINHALTPEGAEEFALGFGMGIGMQGSAQLLGAGSERAVEEMAASLLDDGIIEEMATNRSAFEQAKKDFNKGAQLTLEEKLDARVNQIVNTTTNLVQQGVITENEQARLLNHVAAEAEFKLSRFGESINNRYQKQLARSIFHQVTALENDRDKLIKNKREANEADVNTRVEEINNKIEELKESLTEVRKGITTAKYIVDDVVLSREEFRDFVKKPEILQHIKDGSVSVEIVKDNLVGPLAQRESRDDLLINVLNDVVDGKLAAVDAQKYIDLATETREEAKERIQYLKGAAELMNQTGNFQVETFSNTEDFIAKGLSYGISKEDMMNRQGVYFDGNRILIDESMSSITTLYHETLHPVVENVIKSVGKETFNDKVVEFFNNTPEATAFMEWAETNYGEKALTERLEEALVEYHAHNTRQKLDDKLNEERGMMTKFIDFLRQLFMASEPNLSITEYAEGMSVLDYLDMVTDDFVNVSISDPSKLSQPLPRMEDSMENLEETNKGPIRPKSSIIGERAMLDVLKIDNLILAKDMTEKGKDPLVIKRETGWELGSDGQWRYELMPVKLKMNIGEIESGRIIALEDLVDLGELSTLYGSKITPEQQEARERLGGSYITSFLNTVNDINKLSVSVKKEDYYFDEASYNGPISFPSIQIELNTNTSNEKFREILIHEIQHHIQEAERFEEGSNPMTVREQIVDALVELQEELESGFENKEVVQERYDRLKNLYDNSEFTTSEMFRMYERTYGEVEARNVASRMNLTEEDRRNTLLKSTEDVKDADKIFKSYFNLNKLNVKSSKLQWSPSKIGRGDRAITERNPAVREAAENYYNEVITQAEYLDIVSKESPVKPIVDFIEPANAEDISTAVGVKSEGKVNQQFEEGKNVGLRLDIPAYVNSNIWAITVHEGGATGAPLSYSNVARIKNVDFTSNPVVAMNIARHAVLKSGKKMGKATIARMQGEWVPIEGATPQEQGQKAMDFVESILNDETWSQIGMNPFRHSYFYDRADGNPVLSADEVIQIGGLVYAKNVVKTTPQDPAFEAIEKSTGKNIRFSKYSWRLMYGNPKNLTLSELAERSKLAKQIKDSEEEFKIRRQLWKEEQERFQAEYKKVSNNSMMFEIPKELFIGETSSGKAFTLQNYRSRLSNRYYLPKSKTQLEDLGDKVRITIPRWLFDSNKYDITSSDSFVPINGFMERDFFDDYTGVMPANLEPNIEFVEPEFTKVKSSKLNNNVILDNLEYFSQDEPIGVTYVPKGFFNGVKSSKLDAFGKQFESFDLKMLEDKLILITPGDVMGTGVYSGYREGSDIRIEINGGPLFGAKFSDRGALWASTTESAYTSFMNMAQQTEDMYLAIVSQGPISHRGNQEFSKIYIAELEESVSRGELTNSEAIAKINEFINETKKDGKPRWEKIYGNNIGQISDLEDILITKGTYDVRRDFMDALGASGLLNLKNVDAKFETGKFKGFPNIAKMLSLTLENRVPLADASKIEGNYLKVVPRGTLLSVGKINAQNPRGEQIHPGYPITINGEFLGAVEPGVDIASLMKFTVTKQGNQIFKGDLRERQKKLGGYTKNGAVLGEITMNPKASKLPPLDISVDNINMIDKDSMTINGKNVLLNLKKNFTTRGLMDKDTYIRTLGKDFATKARLYDVEKIVRRYQKVMESTYGKEIPLDITETINDALLGRYELIEMLDPNVRSVVEEMRDYIDSMSQQMIDEGIVQGELAGIVSRNLGVYVNRTYEIFENPGYEVPIELFNKAVSGLIESYSEKGLQLTKEEAENILNEVFDEMKEKGLTDTSAYLKVNDIMKRNVKTFKRRKEIPSWMMEAMGETTDPAANFYNTSVKQIHIIEQSLFLSDLRDIGFKNGFLSKTRSEKFPKRIAKAKDSKYNPYFPLTQNEALYTTPEFAEVLKMFTSEPGRTSSLRWGLQTANYLFKYGATVGSVQTHIRNFLSNTLVVMAMGYAPFNPTIFKEMYVNTYPDGKVNESEFRKLISLGIIKDGAYSGEIADIIKDLQGNEKVPYEKMISGKAESIFKKGANILTKAYQAEDDFWKVYLYYALKPDYAKAYPNATDEQLDLMVAKDIAKHVPTYSRIPNAIKQLRKMPLIGTFPSFVSEMIRNNINHVIDIPKMIKDEKTKSMGLKRAVGLLSASLGVEMLIATVKNLLPDWDDEKSEALQQEVPWWSRNSAVVPVEYNDKQVYYFDISSLDPFAHIKKTSKSFAKIVSDGFSQEELIEEYLREAFGPFLGAEPVAEALAECIANRDALGREIYNRTEDGGSIATKCWNHIAKVITPGTLKSIEKIADPKRDPALELLSTFAGVRISKLDLDKTYYFSVQKAVEDSQENVNIYYSVGADATDQEKEEALKTANEKLQETMRKVYQSRINLETLGLDPSKAKRQTKMPAQKNIYLGSTATVSMYSGLYFPIIPNHRDVSQEEYQQVQQSVRQGLIDGLLTESQAENILMKYVVGAKVNRKIKEAVDTGDRTLDFEIERLLKKEIK